MAWPDKYSGPEAIYQLADVSPAAAGRIYERAFYTNNPWVRQAIAQTVSKVPAAMKVNYERLLNDDSYITRELALMNLWTSFPKDRHKYLDKMKGVQGFSNHNVEILWLALAISTLDYEEAYVRDHFLDSHALQGTAILLKPASRPLQNCINCSSLNPKV